MIKYDPGGKPSIMIVGEAPGEKEISLGTPFVGPSGQLFKRLSKQVGFPISECFITNIAHERPLRNVFDNLPREVVERGIEELKKDIERVKPNIILAVGGKALEVLSGNSQITTYRGAVIACSLVPGYKVIGTYHPAFLLRGNFGLIPIFCSDLKKVLRESFTRDLVYPERNIEVIRNPRQAVELLEDLSRSKRPLACDIETYKSVLTAYGIADSKESAFSLHSKILKLPFVLRALCKFSKSPAKKIFHNALFDAMYMLYFYKIPTENIFFDTMFAQHTCYPMYKKSLGFCASIYSNEPYWKDERKKDSNPAGKDALYIYNGKDCCLTYEIYEVLQRELKEMGLERAFELRMKMLYPALAMMYNGFAFNKEAQKEFLEKHNKELEILDKLLDAVIPGVNINSSKQMVSWLKSQGFKNINNANETTMTKLEKLPTTKQAILGLIRVTKKKRKQVQFYETTPWSDGRLRSSLSPIGTYTGRWASSKSIVEDAGRNMLNLPKRARIIYGADPGEIIVQADASQIEARIVAALCKDKEWVRQFDEMDLHSYHASLIFDIPIEKVHKTLHRYPAKRVVHASNYDMGWKTLSNILLCSAKEAKRLIAKYHEIRPEVRIWHKEVKKKMWKQKYLETFYGTRMYKATTSNEKAWIAFEPQSTAADFINTGIDRLYNELDLKLQLQVYDSVIFSVPDDLECVIDMIQAAEECFRNPLVINNIPLKIPMDFEIGYDLWNTTELAGTDRSTIKDAYQKQVPRLVS